MLTSAKSGPGSLVAEAVDEHCQPLTYTVSSDAAAIHSTCQHSEHEHSRTEADCGAVGSEQRALTGAKRRVTQ